MQCDEGTNPLKLSLTCSFIVNVNEKKKCCASLSLSANGESNKCNRMPCDIVIENEIRVVRSAFINCNCRPQLNTQ